MAGNLRQVAIFLFLVWIGLEQDLSAFAYPIPKNDKCATQKCPKSGICPTDSNLPQMSPYEVSYDLNRRKRDLTQDCCTEDRCICNECSRPATNMFLMCGIGQVLLVVKRGNGQPGTCCDQYECGEKPICEDHNNPIKYYSSKCIQCDSCERPRCKELCYESDLEVQHCWSQEAGEIKMNGTTWTEQNGCRQCRCNNGESLCTMPGCKQADCKNPQRIEGECCPTCPEDDEIKGLPPVYSFTESTAKSKNDAQFVSTSIDEILIVPKTTTDFISNDNENSTEKNEELIADLVNSTETLISSNTEKVPNLTPFEDIGINSPEFICTEQVTVVHIEVDDKIPYPIESYSTEKPSVVNNFVPEIEPEKQSEFSDNDNSYTVTQDFNEESNEIEISSSSSSSTTDAPSSMSMSISSSIRTSATPTSKSSFIYKNVNIDRNYRTTEENQNMNFWYIFACVFIVGLICIVFYLLKKPNQREQREQRKQTIYSPVSGSDPNLSQKTDTSSLTNFHFRGSDKQ